MIFHSFGLEWNGGMNFFRVISGRRGEKTCVKYLAVLPFPFENYDRFWKKWLYRNYSRILKSTEKSFLWRENSNFFGHC